MTRHPAESRRAHKAVEQNTHISERAAQTHGFPLAGTAGRRLRSTPEEMLDLSTRTWGRTFCARHPSWGHARFAVLKRNLRQVTQLG